MTKMTYAEQLKHPNWQRRRLECLEAANWECEECGAKEKTLHVHHVRYIKGRMVWEYGSGELKVLCEHCHSDEHGSQEILNEMLALTRTNTNAALIAGFNRHSDWIDPGTKEVARQDDVFGYAAGFIAYIAYEIGDIDKLRRVAEYAASLHTPNAEARLVYELGRGNTFGEDG